MKPQIGALIFLLATGSIFAQNEKFNPRGKWFFGAEAGINTITSYNFGEQQNSLQGGLLAECFFAKQWSVTGRVKYFKTGVSFRKGGKFYRFDGAVVSVPVNLKWQYRIAGNFHGSLKMGVVVNSEVKSDYSYNDAYTENYAPVFASFNTGLGFSYFVNSQTAVYIDYEIYVLGNYRGVAEDWIGPIPPQATNNALLNLGVKYSFKK